VNSAQSPTGQNRYRVYGLTVDSWIPFPELPAAPDGAAVDVVFRLGEVPVELPDRRNEGACFQVAPGRLLIWLKGVARFYAVDGKEIIVEPAAGAVESDIRLLLLCSPMGALLLQRGLLPLHASAIATPEGAVLFMGASGSGKSTLAAEFGRRGFSLVADDISVVQFGNDGNPLVLPGYPQSKLWPDVTSHFGLEPSSFRQLRSHLAKVGVPVSSFHARALPLVAIYLLAIGMPKKVILQPLLGTEKLKMLLAHTYRQGFVRGMGVEGVHFQHVAQLANKGRILRADRFKVPEGFVLNELADVISTDLKL